MTGRPDLPPGFDAYKTLQVDPDADPEVVQAAYRRLARKFHPDVAPGAETAARMVAINMAWETLGDAASRAAYDLERGRHAARSPDGAPTGGAGANRPGGATGGATAPGAAPPPSGAASPRGASGGAGAPRPGSSPAGPAGETVSRDWTSGRSSAGSGYDPHTMGRRQEDGAAGPPPGSPSGSVLNFGRFAGWSIGEIARVDLEYLEWLDRAPIGRAYREEIDVILRRTGRRRSAETEAAERRGLFRRR